MTFIYILVAIAVLLLMITIHELGHYIAGKKLGFKINEFAIGMGKKLYSRKNEKTGEVFSIRLFPLGGYCAFDGEDENSQSETAFNKQAPWKRLVVLFSGVFFNFVSAIIFSVALLMIFGYSHFMRVDVLAPNQIEGNPAYLQKGDVIMQANGNELTILKSLNSYTNNMKVGETIQLKVNRNGEELVITANLKDVG